MSRYLQIPSLLVLLIAASLVAFGPGPHTPDLVSLKGAWAMTFQSESDPTSLLVRGVGNIDLSVVGTNRRRFLEGPYTLAVGVVTKPDHCITDTGIGRLEYRTVDTLGIDFNQGGDCGIYAEGTVHGDSIRGRWYQETFSGHSAAGAFLMTRVR